MKLYIKIALSCLILSGIVQSANNIITIEQLDELSGYLLEHLSELSKWSRKNFPNIDKTGISENAYKTIGTLDPQSITDKLWANKYRTIRNSQFPIITSQEIFKKIYAIADMDIRTEKILENESSWNLLFARIGRCVNHPEYDQKKIKYKQLDSEFKAPIFNKQQKYLKQLENALGISLEQQQDINLLVSFPQSFSPKQFVKTVNEYPIHTQIKCKEFIHSKYEESLDKYVRASFITKEVECGKKIAIFTGATLAGLAGLGYMLSKKK